MSSTLFAGCLTHVLGFLGVGEVSFGGRRNLDRDRGMQEKDGRSLKSG